MGIVSTAMNLSAFIRGDSDGDGDLDLIDLSDYAACAGGPDLAAAEGCECMDFEGDEDVDLTDYAEWQVLFAD